jgi:putative CocE/NonD family hydrolase
MSLVGRGLARIAKLGPPLTRRLNVERDLVVPMHDGVACLADRYSPPNGSGLPLILIRTPYGRRASRGYAEVFASRGYQVVVQSCRGTFGSGGEWLPFQTDQDDGVATVEWLRDQPWFGGQVGMFGPSYMSFVQWAMAADCPDEVRALSVLIGTSEPRQMMYPGGAFSLRTMLAWVYLVGSQAQDRTSLQIARGRKKALAAGFRQRPLSDADQVVLGHHFPFWQQLVRSGSVDAPVWRAMDFSDRVAAVDAPTCSLTGWYDIFLLGQLADYQRLTQAGRQPRLVIGPWGHTSLGWLGPALRESLRLFDRSLRGVDATRPPTPVRIHLMGAKQWLDLAEWPPPTCDKRLYLGRDGCLEPAPSGACPPDGYRFDPADPTPAIGGTSDPGHGSFDNRKLESRDDVLTYTSEALDANLDVIGRVTARLHVRSTLEHTDFFARLCDVTRRGRSRNVCDGLVRLTAGAGEARADGTHCVAIELWPTAYRFKKGHRIRLQVSSASFPRFDLNPGAESSATATTLLAADQDVFHDEDHPSEIILPVYGSTT